MRFKWIKVGLGGLIAIIFAFVNVSASQSAQASTLKDGTYSVHVDIMKEINGAASSAPSEAAGFLKDTAQLTVKDGVTQASVPIQPAGQKFIVGATASSGNILGGNSLNLTYPAGVTSTRVTFDLMTPMGKMQPSAWFILDLSQVPTVAESASSSSASSSSNSTVAQPNQSADVTAQSNANSTVEKAATDTNKPAPKASQADVNKASSHAVTTTKAATTKPKATSATLPMTGWTYEVLQADNQQVSAANKFFTHAAQITKVGNQYQVQLTVKYGKNSGMTEKGFTPLTTNGEAAQNVTYSTVGNDYVVTYTFDVAKLSDLTQLINGTVHVTVPMVGINQDFSVRFKFNHAGVTANNATDTSKAAPVNQATEANRAVKNGTTPATTTRQHQGMLPQTNDQRAVFAAVVGFVTLLAVSGGIFYQRRLRHAK